MENKIKTTQHFSSNFSGIRHFSTKGTIGIIAGILLFSSILFFALSNNSNNNTAIEEEEKKEEVLPPISFHTILYGNWAGGQSQIFAYDLEKQQEFAVAALPFDAKKVTLISPSELLFINRTDAKDHGLELAIYNTSTQEITKIYDADVGFGIDDYAISPNKKYVAVWEVSFAPETNAFIGGRSQVFGFDLQNKNTKYPIYREEATSPVRYPLAVTDTGQVFMDRFLPNSGAGWAYGMSTSDIRGTNIQDLPQMATGTYGTQPTLSPDGSLLLFAGYDGVRGDGNQEVRSFRRAILTPNTIEILDTQTLERRKLPFPNSNTYTSAKWDTTTGNIIATILSASSENTGNFIYDLETGTLSQAHTTDQYLVGSIDQNTKIYGKPDDSEQTDGNLGDGYAQSFTQLFVEKQGEEFTIPSSSSFSQIIDVIESGLLDTTSLSAPLQGANLSGRQLQLQTFDLKPELPEEREEQQSEPIPTATPAPEIEQPPQPEPTETPKCRHLVLEICNEITGLNYSSTKAQSLKNYQTRRDRCDRGLQKYCKGVDSPLEGDEKRFVDCYMTQWDSNYHQGLCKDSPLYLYGPENLSVDITIHTPIFSENNIIESFTATFKKGNSFSINNQQFESLDFDYQAAIRTRPPLYGTVVNKKDVETVVRDYSNRLGLNNKETEDLVKDIKAKTVKDYVFFSFYTQDQSKYILPISFDPKPDTYINYVFYLRNLDTPYDLGYSPKEPEFEKTERKGEFVAVEISVDGS